MASSDSATRSRRVPVRSLTPDRYADVFATFVARSGEYPWMLRRLAAFGDARAGGYSCLDVGAGTGMLVRTWIEGPGRGPTRYVAVEPNRAHAQLLRQTLATLELDGAVHEQAYGPEVEMPGRYDLVLFSHSLYWMEDPVGCVRRALESVAPGGTLLAFLQGPFGVHPFFRLFEPLFERDAPRGPDHGLSSHELVVGLREAGLTPSVELDPSVLDLTGLFEPGAAEELEQYLSFCLAVEFESVPEPIRGDAIRYLRAACHACDGRLLWLEPTAAITLAPP